MSSRAVLVKVVKCMWVAQQQVLFKVLYTIRFLFLTLLCSFRYMQVLYVVVACFYI